MNDSHKLLWPEQPWAMSRVSLLGRLHWNVSCHTNQWEGEAKNVWCGGFNVQCGVVNCRHTCACTLDTNLHAYMLTHANTCAHKLTHTHTQTCACTHTHAHTHTHTHTHTHDLVCVVSWVCTGVKGNLNFWNISFYFTIHFCSTPDVYVRTYICTYIYVNL